MTEPSQEPISKEDWNHIEVLLQEALSKLNYNVQKIYPQAQSKPNNISSDWCPLLVYRTFNYNNDHPVLVSVSFTHMYGITTKAMICNEVYNRVYVETMGIAVPEQFDAVFEVAHKFAHTLEDWSGILASILMALNEQPPKDIVKALILAQTL